MALINRRSAFRLSATSNNNNDIDSETYTKRLFVFNESSSCLHQLKIITEKRMNEWMNMKKTAYGQMACESFKLALIIIRNRKFSKAFR